MLDCCSGAASGVVADINWYVCKFHRRSKGDVTRKHGTDFTNTIGQMRNDEKDIRTRHGRTVLFRDRANKQPKVPGPRLYPQLLIN